MFALQKVNFGDEDAEISPLLIACLADIPQAAIEGPKAANTLRRPRGEQVPARIVARSARREVARD